MGISAGPFAALLGSFGLAPLIHAWIAQHAGRLWGRFGYAGAWLLSSAIATGLIVLSHVRALGGHPDSEVTAWITRLTWAAVGTWCLALGVETWLVARNAAKARQSGRDPAPFRFGCLGFSIGFLLAALPFLLSDFVTVWQRASG